MKRFLLATVFVATSAAAEMTVDELDRREAFDAWVIEAFRPQALKTVHGIRALHVLHSETKHDYSVGHATSELELRRFEFDGLAIDAILEQSGGRRVWVSSVWISNPDWPLENGLAVGQDVVELGRLPVQPKPGTLEFCGVNNCLIAEERGGRINSLTLEIYVD